MNTVHVHEADRFWFHQVRQILSQKPVAWVDMRADVL
jgi:hypothetical protein